MLTSLLVDDAVAIIELFWSNSPEVKAIELPFFIILLTAKTFLSGEHDLINLISKSKVKGTFLPSNIYIRYWDIDASSIPETKPPWRLNHLNELNL